MSDAAIDVPLAFHLRLPSHPVSVSVARNLVRSLRPYLRDERSDRLELILSEVVTNAVRHGSRRTQDIVEIELTVSPEEVAGCVSDRGPAFTPPGPPTDPEQVGGFGLHIVAQLATTWDVEQGPSGNVVRFTV
jgi:anti-sigma regulatory factor (Ser/Thr protein kinase)